MTRAVRAVAWAPVFVMAAWVLSVVEHADVGIEPAVRTMVVAVLAALVVSIACTMLLRDVPRGGAIATLVVMGLLAGRSLAVWAAVLAAIVLILVERWRARSVRLLPWPRIHEAVTILTLVLMILGGVRVGMQLAEPPCHRVRSRVGRADFRRCSQAQHLPAARGRARSLGRAQFVWIRLVPVHRPTE